MTESTTVLSTVSPATTVHRNKRSDGNHVRYFILPLRVSISSVEVEQDQLQRGLEYRIVFSSLTIEVVGVTLVLPSFANMQPHLYRKQILSGARETLLELSFISLNQYC
jgi:hypothetical protein